MDTSKCQAVLIAAGPPAAAEQLKLYSVRDYGNDFEFGRKIRIFLVYPQ